MPKKAKDTAEKVEKKEVIVEPKSKKVVEKVSKKKASSTITSSKPVKPTTAKKETKKVVTKITTKKESKTATTSAKKKTAVTSKLKKVQILEYYDLPYRYNQTVVKVLAQTPSTLFVYWDISDEDRRKYTDTYGEYFFSNTEPVLIIHNETKNYNYELTISDYANSWYLEVPDSKCSYKIELGRRPINQYVSIPNHYLQVISSNCIETPNDHILFEKLDNFIVYQNIKNNTYSTKDISSLVFLKNIAKAYQVKDFYQTMYKEESLLEGTFDFSNPSSGNPTSTFK